jgi:hypothetical protein
LFVAHITGLFVEPWVPVFMSLAVFVWKNVMLAIHTDIIEIDSTHDISLLPQDARAALNGIRSQIFC